MSCREGPGLKVLVFHLLQCTYPLFSPLQVAGQKAAETAPGEVPDAAQHPAVPGPEQASPP